MNPESIAGEGAGVGRPNAVSIYGQGDAMDDFPVLKAFQQYVNAEQTKAQKRMTTLCIFFALILVMVIGVFVMLLINIYSRNESLNDQLVRYMMAERDRQAELAQRTGPEDQTRSFKAMAESMASFQQQLAEQQSRIAQQQSSMLEKQSKALEEQTRRFSEAVSVRPEDIELAKKNKEDALRLKKALAELRDEKARLERDKKRVHDKQVELYRREHYPESVSSADGVPASGSAARQAKSAAAAQAPSKDREMDDLLGIAPETSPDGAIRYFDDEEDAGDEGDEDADFTGVGGDATSDWMFPLD